MEPEQASKGPGCENRRVAEVTAIAEAWRPYRSLATSYLFSAPAETGEPAQVAPREG